jgi:hypothetical protein
MIIKHHFMKKIIVTKGAITLESYLQKSNMSILQKAIARRKEDGSNQWQDGYPN